MSVTRQPGGDTLKSHLASAAVDGRVLAVAVIAGGLLTLQSSDGLTVFKVGYLLLAFAALACAIAGLRWWLSSGRAPIAMPWLVSAAAFAVLIAASLVVSHAHGTLFSDWLRDVAAYGVFAAAPIFALACARSASRRWIVIALTIFGSLTALSFAVVWLGRRNIVALSIDRIVLPSGGLSAALIVLATALALTSPERRWRWAAAAGAVLGLFFITGTRSSLLLFAAPIGAGLLAGRPWRGAARILLIEGVVAVSIFVAADVSISIANGGFSGDIWSPGVSAACSTPPVASSASPCPSNELSNRLGDTATLFTDPSADDSFQERWTETQVAWKAFVTSPIVGVGPGYRFRWQKTADIQVYAFTLDTPVIYLAKFGLIGLIPLLLYAAAYLRVIVALWRRSTAQSEFLAICGYGIVLLVSVALGSPMEDKGVGFALMLVIGFGCRALLASGQDAVVELPHDQVSVRARINTVFPVSLLSRPNRHTS